MYIDNGNFYTDNEKIYLAYVSNKNTLTGPANCKKQLDIMPIYHYVGNQGKLMMRSRENGQKPQFGQFFDDVDVKYLQIANFSEKYIPVKLKVIVITNFRPKTKKIFRAVFEKNIKVSDFGLIWRPFRKYFQIKIFFQKSGCHFSTFIVP